MKYIFKMFIFVVGIKKLPTIDSLSKENEPAAKRRKKGQPFTRSHKTGDFPALLESAGSLKTRVVYAPLRGAQTVQTPISADSVLLGLREMA